MAMIRLLAAVDCLWRHLRYDSSVLQLAADWRIVSQDRRLHRFQNASDFAIHVL
jgi:hypothetical protein